MLILVCNVGSTSLKYKLFNMPSTEILVEAKTERVGRGDAIFSYRNNQNGFFEKLEGISVPDYAAGIRLFLKTPVRSGPSSSWRPSASRPCWLRAITVSMSLRMRSSPLWRSA